MEHLFSLLSSLFHLSVGVLRLSLTLSGIRVLFPRFVGCRLFCRDYPASALNWPITLRFFVRRPTLPRNSLSGSQTLKTCAPTTGCRNIPTGRKPHEFFATLAEGERPPPSCRAGGGIREGTSFARVRLYGICTRTLRDTRPIRNLDPDASGISSHSSNSSR